MIRSSISSSKLTDPKRQRTTSTFGSSSLKHPKPNNLWNKQTTTKSNYNIHNKTMTIFLNGIWISYIHNLLIKIRTKKSNKLSKHKPNQNKCMNMISPKQKKSPFRSNSQPYSEWNRKIRKIKRISNKVNKKTNKNNKNKNKDNKNKRKNIEVRNQNWNSIGNVQNATKNTLKDRRCDST